MKKRIIKNIVMVMILSITLTLLSGVLSACQKTPTMHELAKSETPLLEAVHLTDLHYVSPSLIENTGLLCYKDKRADLKTFAISSAIIRTALDDIVASGIKYIFISGDLSDNHAVVNHTELAQIFADVESKGVKIFVAPGNHDVSHDSGYEGYRYTSDGAVRVDDFYNQCVDNGGDNDITIESQFRTIYDDFGYSDAITVKGLNYVADVGDSHRLIVVDNCSVDLTTEVVNWAETQVKASILTGKTPILMMHKPIDNIFSSVQPVINLLETHSSVTTNNDTLLKNKLSKAGLKFALTGHNHSNNVVTLKSTDDTATMYDMMAGSLVQLDNSYRYLRFSENYVVSKIIKVPQVDESYLPDFLTVAEKNEIVKSLSDYSYAQMMYFLENAVTSNTALIKEKLAEAIFGKETAVPQSYDGFVQQGVLDLISMPFYRSVGGENSVEALYQKYGATIPQSEYKNILELVGVAMYQVFRGGENLADSQSLMQMLGVTIKAIIVNMIDKGLFELSGRFIVIPQEQMNKVCSDLLQKGEFELLNSKIVHNLLQLPVISELNDIFPILPNEVLSEEKFTDLVILLELPGMMFDIDFEPYFESRSETIDDYVVKTYTGMFYSDKCLYDQLFGSTIKSLIDDYDVPDRDFVMDLRNYEYEKITNW